MATAAPASLVYFLSWVVNAVVEALYLDTKFFRFSAQLGAQLFSLLVDLVVDRVKHFIHLGEQIGI